MSLTAEQRVSIQETMDKWSKITTDVGSRIDPVRAYDIIADIQEKVLNRKPTPIVIVDNIIEAWIACHFVDIEKVPYNQIKDRLKEYFSVPISERTMKVQIFCSPGICGHLDSHIFAAHEYYTQVMGKTTEHDKIFEAWKPTSELGYTYILEDVVIMSQKPTVFETTEVTNADGIRHRILHCGTGPAIKFDGYDAENLTSYFLNGISVPDWLVETHSSKIDISRYSSLNGADQKAEFIRKVGVERMIDLGTKLDSYENYNKPMWTKSQYELYDMAAIYEGVPYAPHLKMQNQTTGVWHIEGVDPKCRTLEDAIRFRLNDPNGELEIMEIA
jgi:hypothetical protein